LEGAAFPFNRLARRVLATAPEYDETSVRYVSLANPEIRALAERDSRIIIQDYSVFDSWKGTAPDIIKIANVLNRDYFSEEMLKSALTNLKGCLKPGGILFVTDNRKREQVSAFVKSNDRLVLTEQVNGGCSVTDIATLL
jgi:chemotaxis methyl-accepting protein methylase